ncbi:Heat shock transcription factor, Y-linked [Heterocephalus glaber]|uniref:Heat shock transcription factor, Y-linked n=1 Tax=Heterocephalus glaber TaxID=10181 RepID=G5AM00_HETGA|nr:Heat shock transcription factor, Y-linked [Heterocephalus glaber]
MHQDPGSQGAQQPEDQNQPGANEEGSNELGGLPFPRKLWGIVENNAFQSVCWNKDGDAVVIDADLFQGEILGHRDTGRIFEADSLKSFIHQLGLYGFRWICPHDSEAQSWGNKTMMGIEAPNPKKKKMAMRHSPRFQKADSRKFQREALQDQGPRGPPPTVFSGIWAMKSVIGHSLDNQAPRVPSAPSGEGTARNGTSAPPAAATEKGAGGEPRSSLAYRHHCALMSLFNTCYSIALTALSAKTPDEHSDAEEQEDASDYKSVLCKQLNDNPQP